MNRRYTAEEFEEVTKRLRKVYDDVILTTDIIVGFPGETDEEFEETFKFLEKIKFFKMHVFKYSIRSGTKAAIMPNQVSGEIKEIRSKRLLALSDENELEYIKAYFGKEVEVLFEEKDKEYYKGHTANYIMVKVKATSDITEQLLKVQVQDRQGLELVGNVKEL